MSSSAASITRRGALGLLVTSAVGACSVRLEDGTSLPGPTVTPAPDTRPLAALRADLVATMAAASRESVHHAEAAAALAAHREHLTRLDATLTGLGAKNLPSPTATAMSTAAPSASSSTSSSPSSSGHASPTASGSSSSASPQPTAWTSAEAAWAGASRSRDIVAVSEQSRPLASVIASVAAASLPADMHVAWMPDAALQPGTKLLPPVKAAIEALEWLVATTPVSKRADMPALLTRLYAVRSLADSSDLDAAGRDTTAGPRFTDAAAARKAVGVAGVAMAAAAASAARSTPTARHANGLVLAWSSAIVTQRFAGMKPGAFPGLQT